MPAYQIDSGASEVFVEARSNVHPIEIRTQGLSGTIEVGVSSGQLSLVPAPRAKLEIASELLRSGIDLYDSEIHRRIEVRKFRTIRGELLDTTQTAPEQYRLRGTLSFHGVTRDLEGDVAIRVRDGGAVLEIEGSKSIDMRDFGLEPPKILMLEVQPQVSIRAKIRAVRS